MKYLTFAIGSMSADLVQLLEGQIDEARRTRPVTLCGTPRRVIRKRQLVPLAPDPSADTDPSPPPAGTEAEPPPAVTDANPQRSETVTDPAEPDPDPEPPSGGSLWGEAPDAAALRLSARQVPTADPPADYCLMDLIMDPPTRKLQRTHFTYFDLLMEMGEV
jgi:hypothetical protein